LEKRKALYAAAKEKNPERWSGDARSWHLENRVWLNLERDALAPLENQLREKLTRQLA